jgi:hypothetical protein
MNENNKITMPNVEVRDIYYSHRIIVDIKGKPVVMNYTEFNQYIRKLKIEQLELV